MTDRLGEEAPPLNAVPTGRALVLTAMAVLLAAADWLPENRLVDPDWVEFDLTLALGGAGLAMALRDRMGVPEFASLWNRIVISVVTLAVSLLGAEAATRWVFRRVTISADNSSYFSRRWSGNVALNEYGFRERSFPLAKPAHTYRIAVLGDSFTFGNGLDVAERYSDKLNAWLPDELEVLNFGSPGDNTPHHLHTLRERAAAATPDFVLLQWFVNDIEGDDLSHRPRPWLLVPYPAVHRWLNRHSAFYALANMRWAELQVAMGWVPSYADYLKSRAGDPASADAAREVLLLNQIINLGRSQGAGIGIVLFPDAGVELGDGYPFAFLHERVLGVCRQQAIECLDLRRDFAAVKDRRSLWVSPFDHHPSARANEIAAVKILEVFQRYWVK